MVNIVLITSVIRTSKNNLSYTNTRSVYTHKQRFEQTKKTIETIKEKIPNHKIFIIECSELTSEEYSYLNDNSDYFLNLNDNPQIKKCVHGISKSLGEGSMTICALDYMDNNNIEYDNLIKISGRYWLSSKFNYEKFNNSNIVIKYIENDQSNVLTALYKLPKKYINGLCVFLKNNINNMINCIGYEVLFGKFIQMSIVDNNNNNNIINLSPIGLCGHVSVSNDFYDG
jgi:hypothetical protein